MQVSGDVDWTCNPHAGVGGTLDELLVISKWELCKFTDDKGTYCPLTQPNTRILSDPQFSCLYLPQLLWESKQSQLLVPEETFQVQGSGPLHSLLPQKRDSRTQTGGREKPDNNWLDVQLATDVPRGFPSEICAPFTLWTTPSTNVSHLHSLVACRRAHGTLIAHLFLDFLHGYISSQKGKM